MVSWHIHLYVSLLSAPDDFETQFPVTVSLEVPQACFVLELTDDDIIEDAESLVLQLSSSDPSVIIASNNTVTVIIEDNDCMLIIDSKVLWAHAYTFTNIVHKEWCCLCGLSSV